LSDNQRPVRLIERLVTSRQKSNIWSVSNDNKNAFRTLTPDGPTGAPLQSCIGSPYWNWGPIYTRLFDAIHTGTWDPMNVVNDPLTTEPDSPVGFQINPNSNVDDSVVRSFLNEMETQGYKRVFMGPYETTGQRDKNNTGSPDAAQSVATGEAISDDEYRRLCWFAKGIVQKADPTDPKSADVDAKVPDGHLPLPSDILGPPGAPPGVGLNCNENQ
jgi:hypothetical protein